MLVKIMNCFFFLGFLDGELSIYRWLVILKISLFLKKTHNLDFSNSKILKVC